MVFKCKMCGGDITLVEGKNIGKCEYCKSIMTLPNLDNEKIVNLYNRANNYRLENNFDRAYEIYESILEIDEKQIEARWGLLLCKYGVEYVDDLENNKKVPTCHRTITTSILKDVEYKAIEKDAYGDALELYKNEAQKINEIQKRILEISTKEDPYDIFICYKENDGNGERTFESVIAEDIYEKLIDKGYKVFFARITLEDKLGSEYEPYIYSALSTAKVMLVIGTSEENFNAVWVKNEWSRYLEMMKTDKSKNLIPVYSKIDVYKMPEEFAMLQAQSMDKIGAMQDLIRGIDKLIQPQENENLSKDMYEKFKAMFNEEKLTVDGMVYYEGVSSSFGYLSVFLAIIFYLGIFKIFKSTLDFELILKSVFSDLNTIMNTYCLKYIFIIIILSLLCINYSLAAFMNIYRKYFKFSKWLFLINCFLELFTIILMVSFGLEKVVILWNIVLLFINVFNLVYNHKWIIKYRKTSFTLEEKKKQDKLNEIFENNFREDEKSILKPMTIKIISIFLLIFSIISFISYKPVIQENGRNEKNIQLRIKNDYIRIRESASKKSSFIGTVYKNEIYDIIEIQEIKNDYWYKIKTSKGVIGYIKNANNYLNGNNYFDIFINKGDKIIAKCDTRIVSEDTKDDINNGWIDKDAVLEVIDVSHGYITAKDERGRKINITKLDEFLIVTE